MQPTSHISASFGRPTPFSFIFCCSVGFTFSAHSLSRMEYRITSCHPPVGSFQQSLNDPSCRAPATLYSHPRMEALSAPVMNDTRCRPLASKTYSNNMYKIRVVNPRPWRSELIQMPASPHIWVTSARNTLHMPANEYEPSSLSAGTMKSR